jgi:hypothetical protein
MKALVGMKLLRNAENQIVIAAMFEVSNDEFQMTNGRPFVIRHS